MPVRFSKLRRAPFGAYLQLLVRGARGHDLGVQASRHLDSSEPGAAGRAKDKHCLPRPEMAAIFQPVQSGAVSDGDGRGRFIGDAVGQRNDPERGRDRLFPASIIADIGKHPLANGKSLHPRPKPGDRPRKLTTRREWQLRFRLILAAHDQGIEEIERDR